MQFSWESIVTNVNWTFVINLVQFFLLVAILNRLVYRPLIRFMDQREERLSGQLRRAERQRAQAEAMQAKREDELRRAGAQARAALEVARAQAAQVRLRLRAEAEAEAQRIVEEARRQAAAQLAPVRAELQDRLDALAQVAASRVLGRQVGGRA